MNELLAEHADLRIGTFGQQVILNGKIILQCATCDDAEAVAWVLNVRGRLSEDAWRDVQECAIRHFAGYEHTQKPATEPQCEIPGCADAGRTHDDMIFRTPLCGRHYARWRAHYLPLGQAGEWWKKPAPSETQCEIQGCTEVARRRNAPFGNPLLCDRHIGRWYEHYRPGLDWWDMPAKAETP